MAVSFLSPWLLLAGAAVVLPVIIHLLQRRREVVLPFSMVRFILLAKKRSSRRLQLKKILLLLLRMAAILILVLILARPVVRSPASPGTGSEAGYTAFIIDNSLSMAAMRGKVSRFDVQLDLAREIASRMGESERLALIASSERDRSSPLPAWTGPRTFTESLGELNIEAARGDFAAALEKAYLLLRDTGGRERGIVIITDLARGGWEDFSFLSVDEGDPSVLVRIYRVDGGELKGRAVLGLTVAGESRVAGDLRTVEARILNWGPEESFPLELSVDGKNVDRKVVSLAPGKEGTVAFELKVSREGRHRGEVRTPEDRYREDDSRFFGLTLAPPVKVLLVDGDPGLSLVARETFFLQEALRPERLSFSSSIDVQVVSPEELDRDKLQGRDVVIMANVAAPEDGSALRSFVTSGGGLIVFWGSNCNPDEYRRSLASVLPARPSAIGDAAAGSPFRVTAIEYSHEVLEVFRPPDGGTFSTAAFFRRLEVAGEEPGAEVAARFGDGAPFIVEGAAGRGKVVLFTSTADLAWSDLATKPVFVPLMRRMVLALSGNLIRDEQVDLVAGREVVIPGRAEAAFTTLRVIDPEGRERGVEFLPREGSVQAVFRETWATGFYEHSGTGEEGLFAVNVPPEESDLRPLEETELQSRFQQVPLSLFSLGDGGERAELLQAGTRSLTRPLFIALFFVLLVEMLVAGPRLPFLQKSSGS
jgi:hypothetical protein